jgi:hypothetical protein
LSDAVWQESSAADHPEIDFDNLPRALLIGQVRTGRFSDINYGLSGI